jgi:light-regulated signal transduction histidine kinase (bacteriophytochrome)
MGVLIQENHAHITHDPLPLVLGDEDQLVQLFQNLINNAVKFHGEAAPEVHVGALRVEGSGQGAPAMWQFSVRDNGIGIDSRHFDRIFIMFQRLHNRGNYAGTGIGLAICKKVIERHGGRIWIESQPAQGTTFFFTLRAVAPCEDESVETTRREDANG